MMNLHIYTDEKFDLDELSELLEEAGFSVYGISVHPLEDDPAPPNV